MDAQTVIDRIADSMFRRLTTDEFEALENDGAADYDGLKDLAREIYDEVFKTAKVALETVFGVPERGNRNLPGYVILGRYADRVFWLLVERVKSYKLY